MKNSEIKTNVNFEGAILTSELIFTIKAMQTDDNEELDGQLKYLSNAVCSITRIMLDMSDVNARKFTQICIDLTCVMETIETLRKP